MPLSDDERRRLEELESRLRSDDPVWARTIGNGRPRDGGPRKLVLAILAFLVGLTLVLAGAATRLVLMGAAGFVLECAAAYWLLEGRDTAKIRAFSARFPGGRND